MQNKKQRPTPRYRENINILLHMLYPKMLSINLTLHLPLRIVEFVENGGFCFLLCVNLWVY